MPKATIKNVTKENWKETLMDGGKKTHLMVFMLDPACVECRRQSATISNDLAIELQERKYIKGSDTEVCELDKEANVPSVVRVDCARNKLVCRIFAGQPYSAAILIKDRAVFTSNDPESS